MDSFYFVAINSQLPKYQEMCALNKNSTAPVQSFHHWICSSTKAGWSNSATLCFNLLLHDNIRFNVKQKVIIVPPDLQQEGCLLLQGPLQVGRGHQRSAVKFHNNVTIFDTTSGDRQRDKDKLLNFSKPLILLRKNIYIQYIKKVSKCKLLLFFEELMNRLNLLMCR